MCCAGCAAVSRAIVDSGLDDYYRHRDAMPEAPREVLPEALGDLGLFDRPDFQASFVNSPAEHEREATLLLEGITCAACIWLNEQHVAHQPGVIAVSINYATRRARVRWDARIAKLSDILASVQAIGYRAYPYDPKREEALAGKERRAALWRLFVAGFGAMQVMMYALPEYVAGEGEMTSGMSELLRWASLVLTLPVVLFSAAPFFERAARDLRRRRLGMDVPVSVGIGTAFAASLWATFSGQGTVYFDSVAMFVFFLLCGRYLEMIARQRAARGAEELGRILPALAERLPDWPETHGERIDVGGLREGDVVRIRPGEVVPADAVVVQGSGSADEALLTGESKPVAKGVGDAMIAGSVLGTSALIARVTGVGDSTRLAGIRRLMDRAASERPRIAELADRYASRFVAAVLVAAVLTGVIWWQLDPDRALWICVSVLVVSCPCALSLATPVALTVATSAMARRGVLVTRGHAIESLSQATRFIFDKTGTLTTGELRVEQVVPLSEMPVERIQQIVLGLELDSEHPVARAIRTADWPVSAARADDLSIVTGQGVTGFVEGTQYWLGGEAFVGECHGDKLLAEVSERFAPRSVVFLGSSGRALAALVLSDCLREDAGELVAQLRARGIAVTILSGDAPAVASSVASELGVGESHGGMLPEHKHDFVARMQAQGEVVAMVGDGVNDGPVLAKAHVSVAMGEGSELARNQADVVLLGGRFGPLREAHTIARKCVRIIHQNLGWALAYNLVAMPAAMTGLVTPWMAGLGMSASSLVVILNALRLQRAG